MNPGYPGLILVAAALCLSPSASAQQNHITQQENGRKIARAVRVPAGGIDVDGSLTEPVWQTIPAVTEFVQKESVEGTQPTDEMEVRFAYDDTALYVGARMHSVGGIQAPMGRRDNGDQAEHLLISLDTYLDRRTSSTFGVTTSGVRLDRYYASDRPWDDDDSFDPVRQARTSVRMSTDPRTPHSSAGPIHSGPI